MAQHGECFPDQLKYLRIVGIVSCYQAKEVIFGRDPHTRMLGVSKHIDECAAGLTPQFTIFPFYKILSPSEGMRKNKERFFILKYKPVLNDLKLR